jgi:hypothetical protein
MSVVAASTTDRIDCPGCRASLAYSAALAGRNVCCHHCGHAFAVAALLDPPVTAIAAALVPPPLPKFLNPPPLPARRDRDALAVPSDQDDDDAQEPDAAPTAVKASALVGLVAIYLFGFLVLTAGIFYLIAPGSTRTTSAAPPAAIPTAPPMDVDGPKSLRDVLNDGVNDGVPAGGQPGLPRGGRAPQPPAGPKR